MEVKVPKRYWIGFFVCAMLAVTLQSMAERTPADNAPIGSWSWRVVRFEYRLPRVADRIARQEPIKVVAIGSSSTSGGGASADKFTYPSQLEHEINFISTQSVTVLNRGVNGEDDSQMLKRFERDVIAQKPDLVIWQIGANDALRDHDLSEVAAGIENGIARLKSTGADIILMDLQYSPAMLEKNGTERMNALIAEAAARHHINVFHRFAMMRLWKEELGVSFSTMVAKDRLHMNDWSYGWMAKILAHTIVEAASR